jgi:hypothetical protein
VVEKGAQG